MSVGPWNKNVNYSQNAMHTCVSASCKAEFINNQFREKQNLPEHLQCRPPCQISATCTCNFKGF